MRSLFQAQLLYSIHFNGHHLFLLSASILLILLVFARFCFDFNLIVIDLEELTRVPHTTHTHISMKTSNEIAIHQVQKFTSYFHRILSFHVQMSKFIWKL